MQHLAWIGTGMAAAMWIGAAAHGSFIIDTPGVTEVIDFNDFTGSGFSPRPLRGELDSDVWRATGLSDGDGTFGGSHVTGDFARGLSIGNVATGGVYGFEVAPSNVALGFQPGGSDFTPGAFTLRLQNDTGALLDMLELDFDLYYRNDQDRAGSISFAWSLDDTNWNEIPALDLISPDLSEPFPSWEAARRSVLLAGLGIEKGGLLYLRWQGNDAGGAGNRDEFALDNIMMTAVPGPGVWALLGLGGLSGLVGRPRSRRVGV